MLEEPFNHLSILSVIGFEFFRLQDRGNQVIEVFLPNATGCVAIAAIIAVPVALLDFDDADQQVERD
jgi:hypothetical protein